jgi:hypothetical protein
MRQKSNGMSLNDLAKLAKTNPKYKQLFLSLKTIDSSIQNFIKQIVKDAVPDDNNYYCKTELMNQCYTIYLYNTERRAVVGKTWPLVDFLELCQRKRIEMELNTQLRKMIMKFDEAGISTGDRINWIY